MIVCVLHVKMSIVETVSSLRIWFCLRSSWCVVVSHDCMCIVCCYASTHYCDGVI